MFTSTVYVFIVTVASMFQTLTKETGKTKRKLLWISLAADCPGLSFPTILLLIVLLINI